jgi:protein-S-isoprenylcysteine O-methyltransferase Ste14
MLPFMLGCWIVAGLDVGRFHWSDAVPFGWRLAGLVGLAASLGLSFWAMMANRFFSPVVRIQSERGHHLINSGPYRYLRHPGYLGIIGGPLCAALALDSWWALLPAAGIAFLIVRRTTMEDKFLRRELEGYPAYVEKVRYRLLPGVW